MAVTDQRPTANESAGTEPGSTPSPAPSESPRPAESAPSPSATPESRQGETRETLLDVVKQATDRSRSAQPKEDVSGASPAPVSQTGETAPPPQDDELPDDVPPEEAATYHSSAKRRVDKLLEQRRTLRAEVEGQKAELERLKALEQPAQAAQSVMKFLRDADIGQDDFKLLLDLGAAMRRGDFKTFYEGVRPYVQLAEEYLGISLPQDLQQKVREGQMTAQTAAMFSRERMDRALSDTQRVKQAQMFDARTQAAQTQQIQGAVFNAVNGWESQVAQSDPDYAAKKPLLEQVMWAVVREQGGQVQSPEHAVNIANEAYRRVSENFRKWVPPKPATSRTPSSTGRTSGTAPDAKSLKEAIAHAIERGPGAPA